MCCMKTNFKLTDSQMIDLLGGTTAVANIFKIAPSSVAEWKNNGIPIGKVVILAAELEKKSNGLLNRHDMFPRLWPMIWPELVPARNPFLKEDE